MKVPALLVCGGVGLADAGLADFMEGMAGQSINEISHPGICTSIGKSYSGYSWSMGGGSTTIDVTCSGQQIAIVCKGWPKFTKCTSESADGDNEGGCTCAPEHPVCKKNGWCYKGSKWSTTHCTGTCTASAEKTCNCPATHPTCKSDKWCYQGSKWTATCGGFCTTSSPAPPPPPPKAPEECVCPSDYPFCYDENSWCYKSATSNEYTKKCGGTCAASNAKGGADAVPAVTHGGEGSQVAKLGSCTGLTQQEAQEMLDLHNKVRCAVGTPPIQWNPALQCQAQRTQDQIGAFSHSDCYSLPIEAGENLATGTDISTAVWMWFTEYMQPGSQGHYTAMVWKATTQVGCGIQRGGSGGGVIRCQYAHTAPNFGYDDAYAENVPKFKGELDKLAKCGIDKDMLRAEAKKYQGWGILSPDAALSASLGLFEEHKDGAFAWAPDTSPTLGALAFIGSLAFAAVGLAWRRRSTTMEYASMPLESTIAVEMQEAGLE